MPENSDVVEIENCHALTGIMEDIIMDIIEAVNMLSSFLLMASLCIELQIYAINFPYARAYFS